MDNSFRLPRGFSFHLLHVLIMPAFFICFSSIYDPFSIREFYQLGGKSFFFHFLMLSCIILAVLAIMPPQPLVLGCAATDRLLLPWALQE